MRLRCEVFGCACARDYPACVRCGADLYGAFIETGRIEPLLRAYWWVRLLLRRLGPRRCDQCRKWFYRGYDGELCSEACHDQWLPF